MLLLHALQPLAKRSDRARIEYLQKRLKHSSLKHPGRRWGFSHVCPTPHTLLRTHVPCKVDYIWENIKLTSHFLFPLSLLPCNFWMNSSVFWEGCRFRDLCFRLWYFNFKRWQTQPLGLFWKLILNNPFYVVNITAVKGYLTIKIKRGIIFASNFSSPSSSYVINTIFIECSWLIDLINRLILLL